MHRQSLGSPTSKPQLPHAVIRDNDPVIQLSTAVTESSSSLYEQDEAYKLRKTPPSKPAEKYIHIIPLLTVVCFLILYLSSHDPSRKDMAEFNGFKQLHKQSESRDIDDMEVLSKIKAHEILAIRNLKNMQEIDKEGSTKYHIHRKIGAL